LREKCAQALEAIGFFGYAIGGELREGEESSMEEGLKVTLPHLPADAPRYHMGAGAPEDIVRAVRLGVDHFDCVLPIRNARHGKLYFDLDTDELAQCLEDPERPVEPSRLYQAVDMRKAQWAGSDQVFSPNNPAIGKPYTMGYVHHLLRAEPPSGYRLSVLHNIHFYEQLLVSIREVLGLYGS
jgi:queuine tRNA-ribosyltransferase